MNRESEQEVWRRVQSTGGMTADQALLPERLEAMLLEQNLLTAELKAVSGRAQGSDRAMLNRMVGECGDRSRELRTLYYLLTGRQLRLKQQAPPRPEPFPEALRRIYHGQRQAARGFRQLEREFTDYGEQFSAMAREADRHGRQITLILQRKLEK